jgi:hypothetical protein
VGSHGGVFPEVREVAAVVSLTLHFRFLRVFVQKKKATELQRVWGDKPCPHPAFSREYDMGERTGNYCCTQCGASLSFREKAEIMATREQSDA